MGKTGLLSRPVDPRIWISRSEAARLLGKDRRSMFYLEEKGRLRAARDVRGWGYYERGAVMLLRSELGTLPRARTHDGAVSARAFQMLADGRTRREMVIELREPCAVVDELIRQYANPGDELLDAALGLELRAALERTRYVLADGKLDWPGLVALIRSAAADELERETAELTRPVKLAIVRDRASAGSPRAARVRATRQSDQSHCSQPQASAKPHRARRRSGAAPERRPGSRARA